MAVPTNATRWMLKASCALKEASKHGPEHQSWTAFLEKLVCFRESVACTVCRAIVSDAMYPRADNTTRASAGSCHHHVCKSCMGKKKMMKPSCSWCKDYGNYEPCPTMAAHVSLMTYEL
jgi:male-specific lethal 2